MAREQRRLAAIVSADVAGYSRLMGQDESGTLAALKTLRRDVVDPKIAEHRGRIVKTTGDGLLLEFASVVDAVRCVVEVQTAMAARNAHVPEDCRIVFRVGVNLGDIIIDGDDIFGDGVNVAARLQEIAAPGGLCISSRVHDDVRDRLDALFIDGGEPQLKNIARPVRIWRWSPPGSPVPVAAVFTDGPPSLPDKPSIAVLPFANMSGDPEQEYFADGMVEEIITALSRFKSLFVIARNSSFSYKGKSPDIRQVGKELGVRYVLEGSIRKAANRVRITGQLIDATTGAHLWADRVEGDLETVFDLQDQVTTSVVGAIVAQIGRVEIERAQRRPTGSLTAYDCYLRARAIMVAMHGPQDVTRALELLRQAIDLDPGFARAYASAAGAVHQRKSRGWIADAAREAEEAVWFANRALELGYDDAECLATAGYALAFAGRDLDVGAAMIERALMLNPNLASAWMSSGYVRLWRGEAELALEHLARAVRLSPLDPIVSGYAWAFMAHAHYLAKRYDEAIPWAARASHGLRDHPAGWRIWAAAAAMAGRTEEAPQALARALKASPSLRVSTLHTFLGPYRNPADVAHYQEGLRRAGLPE